MDQKRKEKRLEDAKAYITLIILMERCAVKGTGARAKRAARLSCDRGCQSVVPATRMNAIGYNEPLACK